MDCPDLVWIQPSFSHFHNENATMNAATNYIGDNEVALVEWIAAFRLKYQ